MEIQEFVKKTELVPLAELTTLAATRGCFGDDVLAAFTDAGGAPADRGASRARYREPGEPRHVARVRAAQL